MKYKTAFVGGILALSGVFSVSNTFAESYQREVEVQFNFRSSLAVNISGEGSTADIQILDLAPGLAADSNIITVGITTNNIAGYTASATVGNSTEFTDTNMTHSVDNTKYFASLATNASEATLSTANTWGYSTSEDNGTTWAAFSGLPLYSAIEGKTISTSSTPADDSFKFKINAYASTTQPAGDYENVINFIVVANPVQELDPIDQDGMYPARTLLRAFEIAYTNAEKPMYIEDSNVSSPIPGWRPMVDGDSVANKQVRFSMQDIDMVLDTNAATPVTVCDAAASSSVDGSFLNEALVMDERDGKSYWITKHADGKCWMSQNLDLDLSSSKALTSTLSDVTSSWTPANIGTTTTDYNTAFSNFNTKYYLPASYDPQDNYHYTALDGAYTLYSSTADCISGTGLTKWECLHYHAGNYYSEAAAAATNDSRNVFSSTSTLVNVTESICPAGWRLPYGVGHVSSSSLLSNDEFFQLLSAYGVVDSADYNSGTSTTSYQNQGDLLKVFRAPMYFAKSGKYNNRNGGSGSFIWSGTSGEYGLKWAEYYDSSVILSGGIGYQGHSVRCVAR